MSASQAYGNVAGIVGWGGQLRVQCSQLHDNIFYGIVSGHGNQLDLSQVARNDLTSNPTSILLSQAGIATLYRGENNLVPTQEGVQRVMRGSMVAPCSTRPTSPASATTGTTVLPFPTGPSRAACSTTASTMPG
ncbi:MAG: hypothetical protein OHK0039_46680 [Bacteroidia bacterium]